MGDERDKLGTAVKRIASAERRRGHATWFHASNEFQSAMEEFCSAEWAQVINRRHGWNIRNVRRNPDTYPDCLADFGSEEAKRAATIGIEVTELVDRDAIDAHQESVRIAREGRLAEISDAERLILLERLLPDWPFEKFREHLEERIKTKDRRSRVRSLKQQILLILTAEPCLDEHVLARYLEKLTLPHPKNFDAIYIMGDYVPKHGDDGYYPVFDVSLSSVE